MKILITNDDGFQSPYLDILCEVLKTDHQIHLIAPFHEQSGIGQAISMYRSLKYQKLAGKNYPAYKVDGTPSDCIKLAICHLFREEKFDLVVSGINPGENAGLNALYSGTVAGAREGATWGIPSLALSIWEGNMERARHAADWLHRFLQSSNAFLAEKGKFWNINFPKCPPSEIEGIHIGKMGLAEFKDRYLEVVTPRGHSEYWLDGYKHLEEIGPDTDDEALLNNKIAITPLTIDQTCSVEQARLKNHLHLFNI